MDTTLIHLPLNCEVNYYENFLNEDESSDIYDYIINHCDLKRQRVKVSDQVSYKLNRSTVIFTDEETIKQGIIPKTWGEETPIIIWPNLVANLKQKIEQLTGKNYNICLCNYYENGKRGIGWHSDKEEYGSVSSIASISIGKERVFNFREIDNLINVYSITLGSGSLLIMGENCQERYQHCVVFDKTITEPRINLTFRLFDKDRYSEK